MFFRVGTCSEFFPTILVTKNENKTVLKYSYYMIKQMTWALYPVKTHISLHMNPKIVCFIFLALSVYSPLNIDTSDTLPIYEPPRGKTNNVVSEQVRHKPACTSTEKS